MLRVFPETTQLGVTVTLTLPPLESVPVKVPPEQLTEVTTLLLFGGAPTTTSLVPVTIPAAVTFPVAETLVAETFPEAVTLPVTLAEPLTSSFCAGLVVPIPTLPPSFAKNVSPVVRSLA